MKENCLKKRVALHCLYFTFWDVSVVRKVPDGL